MPIQEILLDKIKCCLHKDVHIAVDPVLVLPCQSSACKQCIVDSTVSNLECYICKQKHEKESLLRSPKNSFAESIIQSSLIDLFDYVQHRIENSFNSKFNFFLQLGVSLNIFFVKKEDSLLSNLYDHVVEIESQIDLRYESLVESIEMCRTEFKIKLNQFRDDMEK